MAYLFSAHPYASFRPRLNSLYFMKRKLVEIFKQQVHIKQRWRIKIPLAPQIEYLIYKTEQVVSNSSKRYPVTVSDTISLRCRVNLPVLGVV